MESIGVDDLVELVDPYRKKTSTKAQKSRYAVRDVSRQVNQLNLIDTPTETAQQTCVVPKPVSLGNNLFIKNLMKHLA